MSVKSLLLSRRSAVVGGVAAACVALTPVAAHAQVVEWGPGTLQPGTEQCVSAGTDSDAAMRGSADSPGVIYTIFRNNAEIFRSGARQTQPFSKYYVGQGFYRFCAKNPIGQLNVPLNNVHIKILTGPDA